MTALAQAQALLATGTVRHRRLRPAANAFAYPTYFVMLPMRSLRTQPCTALRRNRFGLLSFHDADHGDGRSDALAWLDELLAREGVQDATGEVWLQTYPRVLGFAFKPVSFWHWPSARRRLDWLPWWPKSTTPLASGTATCWRGPGLGWGRELQTARQGLPTSRPFCKVDGRLPLPLHADPGAGRTGRAFRRPRGTPRRATARCCSPASERPPGSR